MSLSPLKIAIVGAGPAGLTLARLLFLLPTQVDVTIFEHDVSPTSRPGQGGTLDLHTGTGLAAIDKCQLWGPFRKYARYEELGMIVADKNATRVIELAPSGAESSGSEDSAGMQRPEIDRGRLREILLESVPSNWIKWNHHLKEVTEDGMLRFSTSPTVGPFDLIVGADGAWSKVRTKLHGVKPVYSGVSGYSMKIPEPAKTCPDIDRMVGKGAYSGIDDGKWMSAQRLADDSLHTRAYFLCPEGEASARLKALGDEATITSLLQDFHDWAPEITAFIKQSKVDSLEAWTLYELPIGAWWPHKSGFTLIGDSASLATPFSGEGVNKAMTDSLELAECIGKLLDKEDCSITTLDQAVQAYEKAMFPRAKEMQEKTMDNKLNAFGSGATVALITTMVRRMARKSDSWTVRLLGSAPIIATLSAYFWTRLQVGWAVRTFWRRN